MSPLPVLTVPPGAPGGAKSGCPGDLRLVVDHSHGGALYDCELSLLVECDYAGCYFSRCLPRYDASLEQVYNEATRLHGELSAQ